MATTKILKLALIQLRVSADKSLNLQRAVGFIKDAAKAGANLICLPECFNSPYGVKHFPEYAELVPGGPSSLALSAAARETGRLIIGGSIPERVDLPDGTVKYFNTSTVWSPEGQLLVKYRKMHLFDIDIPGKITFQESLVLGPGNSLGTFEIENCKVGLGICYDLRFGELGLLYSRQGCSLLVYPGSFNTVTGPVFWSLLARARAVDTQCAVALCSPARDPSAGYVSYGHSLLASPWGDVVAEAGHEEELLLVDVDLARIEEIRAQIPVNRQRRTDLYTLTFQEK